MELIITEKAQKWFKEEIAPPANLGIRFFGKVYGSTEVHEGFSIGMTVEKPEHPLKMQKVNGMEFFIEETDEWFFKGYNLTVDYDAALEEPVYHFS